MTIIHGVLAYHDSTHFATIIHKDKCSMCGMKR